jgi:hypothetical protein
VLACSFGSLFESKRAQSLRKVCPSRNPHCGAPDHYVISFLGNVASLPILGMKQPCWGTDSGHHAVGDCLERKTVCAVI